MPLAVDLAHWWWPVGWAWNNGVAGNLAASVVWAAAAIIATALLWPPARRRIHRFVDRKLAAHRAHQAEHERWVAEHIARIHAATTGTPADPHPHHGDVNPPQPPPAPRRAGWQNAR